MAKHNIPPNKQTPRAERPVEDIPPSEPAVEPDYVEVINCERVNLRKGPGKHTDFLTVLPKGTSLIRKMPITSDWVYVRIPDAQVTGYIMREFLKEV